MQPFGSRTTPECPSRSQACSRGRTCRCNDVVHPLNPRVHALATAGASARVRLTHPTEVDPLARASIAIIGEPNLNTHLESFVQAMHPNGGWGYGVGQSPQLEPSCLGLLAL